MQGFLDQHPIPFAFGFAVYFVALWLFVGFVVSVSSGWRSLAKSYQTTLDLPANTMRLRTGSMRWGVGYHNALTLGSDTGGLYMGVLFLFRIGHPRLFIPWNDVSIGPVGKRLFWSTQTLFLGPSSIPLTIRPSMAIRLLSLRP